MGQIWDRIRRIAKSYSDDFPDFKLPPDSSEEELSRIIDELNMEQNKREQRFAEENTFRHQKKQNEKKAAPATHSPAELKKAFAKLGLSEQASIDDIKRAYKKAMLRYHPDRVTTLTPEEQEKAQLQAREINAAYQLLRNVKNF